MNYVGQLAGQVFVTVKDLYKGLNPATLSGCIDIIVVRQPDGSLQCSPFHVRFGKLGVLRSKEKVVDIEINGEPVQLHMKLGDNGEAFFVEEMASNKEIVPFHLNTSPIMSEGAVLMETAMRRSSLDKQKNLESSQIPTNSHNSQPSPESLIGSNSVKKRRKRRRKSKVDSIKRDDNDDTSENEDMFSIEISSEEEIESTENSRYSETSRRREKCAISSLVEGNWLSTHLIGPAAEGLSSSCPQQPSLYPSMFSLTGSRPPTPNSDSELVSKPSDRGMQLNSQMHWAWGELPHTGKVSIRNPITHQKVEEPPRVNIIPSGNTHFRVIDSAPIVSSSSAPLMLVKPEPLAAGETLPTDSFTHGAEEPFEALATGCQMMPENGEQSHPGDHIKPIGKTDSPSKKKDKRSHHLGADGVYLDDITELDPEVAALYFPKCENNPANRSENGTRSESQSPQSVGSSGMDSGVDSFSDTIGDLPTIAISLCGGLNDNKEITKEQFVERSVTYQQFSENPGILEDPNLVVKIGTKYYNWSTAAPMLLAAQAFQKPLPKATVENLLKEKMPKKGGRWWFSWRGRNSSVKVVCSVPCINGNGWSNRNESSSSDDELRSAKQHCSSSQQDLTLLSPASYISYKKTLRLTSEELKSLQLKDGPNDVVFSVTTQYQGTCRCEGTIYLWNWNDRIVISDIDGTITRSDALGHILPTLGKDWTHQGIAKLYHKVSQNGYKFLYCSARAIGMADMTRGYLHWVNEKGTVLPKGPLLLCPSSVFSALHREVIEKKPEKFKIQCLTDIRNLFFPNKEPFYGAFGNRPNDVYSYKQVGVPINRIFTVNPKGELIQEHAKTNVSSYVRLSEIVDHVFPLLKREHSSDFPCSDTYSQFTFWREQLPMVENQDIQASQN
uniref:phosphatidate phosphatase n=1 Tax=Callorhinchus milii TaxID=7868 RepID=A0A4W3I5P5_CALMI